MPDPTRFLESTVSVEVADLTEFVRDCEVELARLAPGWTYARSILVYFINLDWPTRETPVRVARDFLATMRD